MTTQGDLIKCLQGAKGAKLPLVEIKSILEMHLIDSYFLLLETAVRVWLLFGNGLYLMSQI